jgi:kynurenine formamidase
MNHVILATGLFLFVSCQPVPPAVPQPGTIPGHTSLMSEITGGKTRIIDLTHALNSHNPYWPGPGYEPFKYEIFATLERDHVLSGRFSMAEHTGTHLDAPNHFVEGQIPLDKIPLEQLFVPAVVIDVRTKAAADPDYQLIAADITAWELAHGRIPENAVVLMYTGWDSRWNDYDRYKNADANKTLHFPGFSPEAARMLVDERRIAGIGIDTLSVDHGPSKDFAVHHICHGKGKYHLENVAGLGSLPPAGAMLVVAPIKIENGTGGPARIFGIVANAG